jgi:hypothetical protein
MNENIKIAIIIIIIIMIMITWGFIWISAQSIMNNNIESGKFHGDAKEAYKKLDMIRLSPFVLGGLNIAIYFASLIPITN